MKRENLEKATKINQEITRLEQEIEFLDDANMRRTHSIVKALMPNKYTYKGYFCSERKMYGVRALPQPLSTKGDFRSVGERNEAEYRTMGGSRTARRGENH